MKVEIVYKSLKIIAVFSFAVSFGVIPIWILGKTLDWWSGTVAVPVSISLLAAGLFVLAILFGIWLEKHSGPIKAFHEVE